MWHDEVELLAFQLWQKRGAPLGAPEVDWFRAEAELKREESEGGAALPEVAKRIGSALGSVAALVAGKQ